MFDKLRKDSYVLGALMGVLIPAILFGILIGILALLVHFKPDMLFNNPDLYRRLIPKILLVSMIPSLLVLRHYLLKLKYDKTGRGIVAATFALGIVFVIVQFTL